MTGIALQFSALLFVRDTIVSSPESFSYLGNTIVSSPEYCLENTIVSKIMFSLTKSDKSESVHLCMNEERDKETTNHLLQYLKALSPRNDPVNVAVLHLF